MRFTHFTFKNFKGIENLSIDLGKNPESNVYTLVGLNESGKTTILEAINYFIYKVESLDALSLDNYKIKDIHDLIPINKRDNFNDAIVIEATLELDEADISAIKKTIERETIFKSILIGKTLKYTQKYHFKNSKHIPEKDQYIWDYNFKGRKGRARKHQQIPNKDALTANPTIKQRIPSILYFPNFLFEFPEKIYLDEDLEDPKHEFYRKIIQDILDSLNNDLDISTHLTKRIESTDSNDKRHLASVIGKMNQKVTTVIFDSWNQIFGKEIKNKEIVLYHDIDESGAYLEFNIKDNIDTFRISERSLGFRWFFVYLLFTQFRCFRKKHESVLFLLDEPASNLHPSAQMQLLNSFSKLQKVIYTTHSHYLINPKWLENTFVVKNEGIDYSKEDEYNSNESKVSIYRYREFATKYPNQTSYFQPILEVLDYTPSNLDMVRSAIITEGKNDFYTLNYYQNILANYKEALSFIPGTSSSNLETLISLYMGWGADFSILLDSDSEGLKQKERYKELFGIVITDRIITYEEINPLWKNFETEDLFTDEDKLKIQHSCFPDTTFNKKTFNRSIQENYHTNTIIKISNESINNFEKLFYFLQSRREQ